MATAWHSAATNNALEEADIPVGNIQHAQVDSKEHRKTRGKRGSSSSAVSRAVSSVQGEAELVRLFRDLEPSQQAELLSIAKGMAASHKGVHQA
ncbi:hypothetical protein [Rhodopirellula baltica]|uniref:hypothetical protein n=1 Tax=Rhodopirellula baltica TaxID=265606 RepID=UPI00130E3153|nr:hypothetical protein [Rhodopirellula baltica]